MAKQKSKNKLIKFIAAAVGIILVGSSIAWYAGVQKFKEMDPKVIQHFEKQGFKIDRTEPTYSGFPFFITQNTDSFKGVMTEGDMTIEINGKNIKLCAWILNPGKVDVGGDIYVSISQGDKPAMKMTFDKLSTDIFLDKDGTLTQKEWTLQDASIFTNEDEPAAIKIQEASAKKDSDSKGSNTELKGSVEYKNIEVATKSKPIIIDKIKAKGKIISKYKTYDALSQAIKDIDKDLSQQIAESCKAKTGALPPVGDLVKELEETNAKASGEIQLKMGDFKLELEGDIKVKDNFPVLDAKLVLDDFDKMTKHMVESGALDASSEQMIRLSLSAVADRDADEGDYVIKASLKDRKLNLGANTIREFKEIDWNNLPVPDDFCQKYQTAEDKTKGLMLSGLTPYISYPVF